MPSISPSINEALVLMSTVRLESKRKGELINDLCATTGKSRATIYRQLKLTTVQAPRRRRSDAGKTALTRQEAVLISKVVMEHMRKNNQRLHTIDSAVKMLRANGAIRAERIDPATGECVPMSTSAIASAMRHYKLHPDQLLQPEPARELRSLHPNHVWQIDASLCVLYYLETDKPSEMGLQVMEEKVFNKNKPKNLKRIENRRVWSYEITDHNSGYIFAMYVLDGESSENIIKCFLAAIQQRGSDPFYGVPKILMMDMGSANTSGLFKNLLRRLDVETIAHAPGNARATGSVEVARNILQCSFESGLKLKPVLSLDDLNARVARWLRWFNATAVHSRHEKTRSDQWMTITQEQLRIAPSPELCRELVTHTPVSRIVTDHLRIEFNRAEYDVSGLCKKFGVVIGESLQVTYNPYVADAAQIVFTDADGNEHLASVPKIIKGDDGFSLGEHSNVIGEDWRRAPQTIADVHRKELELMAMEASTLEEAAAKRKAKTLPFGGRIDPEAHIIQAQVPTFLPRKGTPLVPETRVAQAEPELLAHFTAARALGERGVAMNPELVATLKSLYPEGVPDTELDALQARLTVRSGLRVVAGGGA